MNLLSLETSFGKFSIALFREGKLVDNFLCERENEQAELLIPAIEEMLARNKIQYSNLAYIAVGIGPGSFTGLRIGMAAAKGLALATKAKLIGVSSLEAAAHKQGGGQVYLNAQRGQAYFQDFDSGEPAKLVVYEGDYSPLPDAENVGYVAHGKLDSTDPVRPLYIRKPDAKFRLRSPTDKDLDWLTSTHAACFTNKWTRRMIADSLKMGKCIIADRLGFLIYEVVEKECEIKTIAVLPDARRKGVARFMWDEVAKNLGRVRKVFLEVEADNGAAIGFYEKLGFETFSTRKNYYGENRDALLMVLK